MTMDYSPWSEREIWLFLRVPVSPKPERSHPPKSVYMYVTSILTCMILLSRFRLIKIFDDHGPKRKFGRFESTSISETGEVTPTKISVHVSYINPYMHDFFEPIPIPIRKPSKMQRVLSTSPSSSDSASESWVAIEKKKKNTATIKYSIILFV